MLSSAIAIAGISITTSSSKADTLYRVPGAGSYGGDAYEDSSGNWYDDDPMYGDGPYGGGVIIDQEGNNYDCDRMGECTPW